MKALRVEYRGLKSFYEGSFRIDLVANGRVSQQGAMSKICGRIYTLPVLSFAGINASGKTTVLRLLDIALGVVCQKKGLYDFEDIQFLESVIPEDAKMTVVFASEKIYELTITFGWQLQGADEPPKCYIKEEVLKSKTLKAGMSRKNLFDFSDGTIVGVRSKLKQEQKFIDDKISIANYLVEDKVTPVRFDWKSTVYNLISTMGKTPAVVLRAFDNNIEMLQQVKPDKREWYVKFANNDTGYQTTVDGLSYLLSSGTIKGQNLFFKIYNTLHDGGYLLVDELENHLNKELIRVLIDFFLDPTLNRNGAVLIFSTHYGEVIDYIERMDSVYFCQKDKGGLKITKYADCNVRGELKKSEVFFSSYCGGTAPFYEDVKALKEYVWNKN